MSNANRQAVFEITHQAPDFPTALAQAHPPVRTLFGQGCRELISKMALQPGLAIVGSRQASAQGLADAHWYAKVAAQAGLTIISGLAQGIDASAHVGSLEGGGTTIAVLGHGLQSIYPSQHQSLSERILSRGGALVTEYPWGTPALPHHFPQRNRIIAGLARAILIVEATPQSGSLITARHALDIGIDVFVLPGSIHMPHSIGCNALIRQGAQLSQSPEQLLEDLGLAPAPPTPQRAPKRSHATSRQHPRHKAAGQQQPLVPELDPVAAQVLATLSFHPTAVSDLCTRSQLNEREIYGALLILELCGLTNRTPDGKWLKQRVYQ
jgi:DNA processing protein